MIVERILAFGGDARVEVRETLSSAPGHLRPVGEDHPLVVSENARGIGIEPGGSGSPRPRRMTRTPIAARRPP